MMISVKKHIREPRIELYNHNFLYSLKNEKRSGYYPEKRIEKVIEFIDNF